MGSWLMIDIADLIEQSQNQKSEDTGAANVGAGAGGATTSANVGPYAKPFGGMLRKAPYPMDKKAALDYAYGRKKRRKSA